MLRVVDRIAAGFEIVFVAFIGPLTAALALSAAGVEDVLSSVEPLFAFLMVDAAATLLAIAVLLRLNGQSGRRIGAKAGGTGREILLGMASVPLLFAAVLLIRLILSVLAPSLISIDNPLLSMIRSKSDWAFFLVGSVLAGGFREEVQRAFVLDRFGQGLGGAAVGLPLWSLFFGLMHVGQGPDRAVAAGFLGLAFGCLYLARRHLAAPIVAHALFNAIVVTASWFVNTSPQ